MPGGGCVGILAGAGPLPAQVAAAALEKGKSVFVVGFRDFADTARLAPYAHEIIRLAAVGEILAALKKHGCRELVLIDRKAVAAPRRGEAGIPVQTDWCGLKNHNRMGFEVIPHAIADLATIDRSISREVEMDHHS